MSALHSAAWRGDTQAIRDLVAAGAAVDSVARVSLGGSARVPATPLMVAAGSGAGATVETLRLLVELGAEPAWREQGRTALRFAAGGYDLGAPAPLDCAERLNLGADPARFLSGRAGFRARRGAGPRPGGDASRVRYLLEHGCWADETDYDGVTVLAEAAMTGDPARVAVLIEYGASPDPTADALLAMEPDGAWTVHLDLRVPLFAAAASSVAVLAQLVEGGAHLRLRDERNNTALYFARDAETARWLVAAGLDLEQRTTGDRTPLMVAVDEGDVTRARALLLAGANPNATHDRGYTVLMLAASSMNRSVEMLKVLVEHGADPRAVSELGWNALHAALDVNGAEANRPEVVKGIFTYLHELGLNRNRRNPRG